MVYLCILHWFLCFIRCLSESTDSESPLLNLRREWAVFWQVYRSGSSFVSGIQRDIYHWSCLVEGGGTGEGKGTRGGSPVLQQCAFLFLTPITSSPWEKHYTSVLFNPFETPLCSIFLSFPLRASVFSILDRYLGFLSPCFCPDNIITQTEYARISNLVVVLFGCGNKRLH